MVNQNNYDCVPILIIRFHGQDIFHKYIQSLFWFVSFIVMGTNTYTGYRVYKEVNQDDPLFCFVSFIVKDTNTCTGYTVYKEVNKVLAWDFGHTLVSFVYCNVYLLGNGRREPVILNVCLFLLFAIYIGTSCGPS